MKTISKRFLKASVAMLLVVIMLFSSTISGFAAVVDKAQTNAPAKIYLDAGVWAEANAKFDAWVWGGNTADKWIDFSDADGDGVFEATLGGTYTGIKFYRRDPNSASHDWNNKWADSGDQTIPTDGRNTFYINGWNNYSWDPVNHHTGGYIYFDNSKTNWTDSKIQFIIGHSSYSRTHVMTKLDGTNIYYCTFSDEWTDATYFAVAGSKNQVTVNNWNYDNLSSKFDHYSAAYKSKFEFKKDNTYSIIASGSNNGCTLTPTYHSVGYSWPNVDVKASVYTKNDSGQYTGSITGGTVAINSYKLSGNGTSTASSATNSSNTYSCTAAKTATVTMTATAKSGYKFDGWFESTSATTAVSTNDTYTFTCDGKEKTLYPRFSKNGYSYTVTAGEGGKISVNDGTPTANATGTATQVKVTAHPNTGYEFDSWSFSGHTTLISGTNKDATVTIGFDTTFTATASFKKIVRTVTLSAEGATNTYTKSVSATYGSAMPAIATLPQRTDGYTFMGYYTEKDGKGTPYYDKDGNSLKTWDKETATTLYAYWVVNKYTLKMDSYWSEGDETGDAGSTFIVDGESIDAREFKDLGYYETELDHGAYDVTINSLWDEAGMVISKVIVDGVTKLDDLTGYVKEYKLENLQIHKDTEIKVEMDFRGKRVDFNNNGNTQDYNEYSYVEADKLITPPPTREVTGYRFLGWFVDDERVDFSTYKVTDHTTFTAKYEEITYDLLIQFPEGVESVDFWYGYDGSTSNITEETMIEGIPYNEVISLTVHTTDEYRSEGFWTTNKDGLEIEDGAKVKTEIDGSKFGVFTVTPKLTRVYKVTVNGVELDARYAEGEDVDYYFNKLPSNQYIESVEGLPKGDDYNKIGDNGFSFKMPEGELAGDVELTVYFGTYYFITLNDESKVTVSEDLSIERVEGEEISFTVSANTGVTLNNVSFILKDAEGNENPVVVESTDGKCEVSFTMPAHNVEIIVDASAQHKVSYEMKAVGNYNTGVTSGFGTVTIKDAKGHTVDNNGYAEQGKVVFTAEETHDKYTFAGFFSDSDCKNVLSYSKTYEPDITGDTKVYVLFARKQYITYDRGKTTGEYVKEFTYDAENGVYRHITTLTSDDSSAGAMNSGAWFLVTNDTSNSTKWQNYCTTHSNFTVTLAGGVAKQTTGGNCWSVSGVGSSGLAEIVLTPTWSSAIKVKISKVDESNKTKVYLSSGRRDLTDRKAATVNSSSSYVSTHVIAGGATPISRSWGKGDANNYYNVESYTTGLIAPEDISEPITVQTTLAGDEKDNFFVKTYVLYHSDGYIETLVASPKGNNTYETTFNITAGKSYIVTPIFWYTEEYAKQTGKKAITVYFDRTEVPDTWGPFVSCYPYGDKNGSSTDVMGGWPGQLMIPLDTAGNKYYTQFVIDTAVFTPQAVTFSNYMWSSTPNEKKSEFGLSNVVSNYQTYDYGEPIYLFDEGFSTITYKLKQSSLAHRWSDKVSSKSGWNYELMVNESGEAMSLTAHVVEDPKTATTADFYIVAGEKNYKDGDYTYDENYAGEWSTVWTIFYKDGTQLGKYLSGSIYDGIGEETDKDPQSVLVKQLIKNATLKGKSDYAGLTDAQIYEKLSQSTVAICYNRERGQDGATRFDGQWYGTLPSKKYTISVEATLRNGSTYTDAGSNIATYGQAFVSGDKASDEIVVNTEAALTANALSDENGYYTFVGWFTKDANGKYTCVETRYNYNPVVASSQKYYAVFEKLPEGVVQVTQERYSYKGADTSIHSHDGISSLYVEIQECDEEGNLIGNVLDKGTPNTYSSSAKYQMVKDHYYRIYLKATPNPGSTFFAWYSKAEEGLDSYEEVLTEKEFAKDQVAVTSFIYQATGESQSIIIYADTITPGMYTKLVYKYTDRFGDPATYTVNNVKYTEDEIKGYPGNGGTPFYPTYLTEYKMRNSAGNEKLYYGDKGLKTAEAEGYTRLVSSYNMIQKYAPDDGQTVVYDSELKWDIILDGNNKNVNINSSVTYLQAVQANPTYTIFYEYNGTSGEKSGVYNTLLDNVIVADMYDDNGTPFSHWVEVKTVDDKEVTNIISYYRQYNYRITETKTIRAVYAQPEQEKWTPTIDSVTITREIEDGMDTIYTDYLLTFANSAGKELDKVKEAEKIRYGLMLTYDPKVASANVAANAHTDKSFVQFDTIKDAIKQVAIDGKSQSIMNKTYNTYCFELTQSDTTNFNRMDYFLKYNNLQKKFDKYNFTAVAYIIVDNEVILSNAQFVNFYKEANSEYMQ